MVTMTASRTRKSIGKAKGFTLIELLIVVALLIIVGSISYGAFQRMAINGNLRTAARDITSEIANLRQRAMAETTALTMTFGAGTYTVPQQGGGAVTKNLTDFGRDIVFTRVDLGGGGTTLTFQSRGTTMQGGNVDLQNSRQSTAVININAAGRVNVQFNMQ